MSELEEKKNSLVVFKVSNGYVVKECGNADQIYGKTQWVAKDETELLALMDELFKQK